ncbi:MAG: ribonuclease Z [Muribaculaceae bacterium]|nr:ribonuclease Z [Muribaculaceae bacterium]
MSDFTIHTLGCGSAKPSLRHQPSCTVVQHRGQLYMIDCGEGAQLAFMKQRLSFAKLRHIFITHMHGDHVLGLPGLVSTLALTGNGGELTIHTFEDGAKQLKKIIDYFCRDTPFLINYNIIKPEEKVILETKALTVKTVPLDHRIPTVGYIFQEKPKPRHINPIMTEFHQVPIAMMKRIKEGEDFIKPDGTVIPNKKLTTDADPSLSYAHISDTGYIPDLAKKIGPVDLLFHETTYLDDRLADAIERGHSTATQAATVARDAGAKMLLTGHYSSRYTDDSLFLKEAQQVFPNVILNNEGLRINLLKGEVKF